jgi:hypothetical protein
VIARVRGVLWDSTVGLVSVLGVLALLATVGLFLTGRDEPERASVAPLPVQPPYQPSVQDVVAGELLWTDDAVLDADGLELDAAGPRRGAGDVYTRSWGEISARPGVKVALWVSSTMPTSAQCVAQVTVFGRDAARAESGGRLCVVTSDGRPALIKLVRKSAVGPYGWLIQASVWSQ